MTRIIIVAALFAGAVCAQAKQQKSEPVAPTAAPAPVSPIPKDAIKNADGTWSYTDKQGRKFRYVNSPFGVIKTEVTDEDTRSAQPINPATKVIDKGDTVRFEQPGPFGTIAWEKKKSELTDPERQLIDAQKKKQPETAKPETK